MQRLYDLRTLRKEIKLLCSNIVITNEAIQSSADCLKYDDVFEIILSSLKKAEELQDFLSTISIHLIENEIFEEFELLLHFVISLLNIFKFLTKYVGKDVSFVDISYYSQIVTDNIKKLQILSTKLRCLIYPDEPDDKIYD